MSTSPTVCLSSDAEVTDTHLWPEFLVASGLTLVCRAGATH
ncbi:hypothetical protein [Streptacidiphilus neutrinimicus]|nr:hypothetical protein [Streptacidiphilus neutrinimicus]